MYKTFENGRYFQNNLTTKTLIRVEGLDDYTIIDALSIDINTYLLLESYAYGEEDMCIIDITTAPIIWMQREDGKPFHKHYEKKAWFSKDRIVVECAYNDIITELEDCGIIENNSECYIWENEEIDKTQESEEE